jgi:hypothetical protein
MSAKRSPPSATRFTGGPAWSGSAKAATPTAMPSWRRPRWRSPTAKPHDVADLRSRLGETLTGQGWQTGGQPMTAADHANRVYMAINPWRVWGFVDY